MKKIFLTLGFAIISLFPIHHVDASEHIHQWSDWEIIKEATCKDYGSKTRHCLTCMDEEFSFWKTDIHTWDNWITLLDNTCSKDGKKYRQCSVCGKIEYSTLPKDSSKHLFDSWQIKKATIFSSGRKTRNCLYCHKKETVILKKLHAHVTLRKKTLKLKKSKTYALKIKTYTKNDKVKCWKSSNKKIITINSKGKIKAKKKGNAKVTLYMKSGATATCTVKVK